MAIYLHIYIEYAFNYGFSFLFIMSLLSNYLIQSITLVYSTKTMSIMPFLMAIVYMIYYYNKRYRSPLALAPLAPAEHFLVKYFGLVPPPNDAEKIDTLSRFLIRVGQDPSLSPISVCWSITGTPLVIVSTLKGIKDVLIDGQAKSKVKDEPSKVQRGNLIRLIQNLVFGGKSLNNVVGEVSIIYNLF